MSDLRAIEAYVDANLDAAVDELSEYCRQPSVSATGQGIEQCADLVVAMLQRRGLIAERFPTAGHPIVVGRAAGEPNAPRLLFYCHYDVQPPDPLDLWLTEPFAPSVREGALYARGALDDKGELIARLLGLDAVRSINGDYPCEIGFLVEGEEETGSANLEAFIDSHFADLDCQGAIWESGAIGADGRPRLDLGSRGTLYVELTVRTLDHDAHSGHALLVPSAAWRLTWALASLKGSDERILIPGFDADVREASGRELALLEQVGDETQAIRTSAGVQGVFAADRSHLQHAGGWRYVPTCNIDGITTGYQGEGMKTIVPAVASAKLDFRLVPDQRPDDVLSKLRAHLDRQGFSDIEIAVLEMDPAGQTDPDAGLVRLWAETAEEVYGRPGLISPLAAGTTPLHFFTSRGIPVVSVGAGYENGLGNNVHAPNEHVRLNDLAKAAIHTGLLTLRFASEEHRRIQAGSSS